MRLGRRVAMPRRLAVAVVAALCACLAAAEMGKPMPYAPDVDYGADWAYGSSSNNLRLRRQQHRAAVAAKAAQAPPQATAKAVDHEALPRAHVAVAGAPAPAPGPAPGPAPAPGPVPAPAPLTWAEQMVKKKEDMTKKLGGNSFDADYVLNRPNEVKPGEGWGKEHPVRSYADVYPHELSAPASAPSPGSAPSPAPMGYIPFTEASLPAVVNHKNQETMVDNWRSEYGPAGPQRDRELVHGPNIVRSFKGWSYNPTIPPPARPVWGMLPKEPFVNATYTEDHKKVLAKKK